MEALVIFGVVVASVVGVALAGCACLRGTHYALFKQ
jgi:hypothetical protein